MPHHFVKYVREELRKLADPEKAKPMQAYMKNQQQFYGVQAKPRYQIFREAKKKFEIESIGEYRQVILELWKGKYREEMYQALEVAGGYKPFHTIDAWEIYLELLPGATWWDTLDWLAGHIMSPLVAEHRELEVHLVQWRECDSFWVRRASLLAHLKHKGQTNKELLSETIYCWHMKKSSSLEKRLGGFSESIRKPIRAGCGHSCGSTKIVCPD